MNVVNFTGQEAKWMKRKLSLSVPRDEQSEFYVATYNIRMYWIYVLECQNDKSWYIGYTSNLRKRLVEHQSGYGSGTTKKKKDWKLIYCEGYLNIQDVKGREIFLRSGSGRRFLKKQLKNYLV